MITGNAGRHVKTRIRYLKMHVQVVLLAIEIEGRQMRRVNLLEGPLS
jgi:hypothetical protein